MPRGTNADDRDLAPIPCQTSCFVSRNRCQKATSVSAKRFRGNLDRSVGLTVLRRPAPQLPVGEQNAGTDAAFPSDPSSK
jgi:hypothetical protein